MLSLQELGFWGYVNRLGRVGAVKDPQCFLCPLGYFSGKSEERCP